jgi:hypothetical protein
LTAYHPLANDDGCTLEERFERVADLCEKLTSYWDQLTDEERGFVERMSSEMRNVTAKQHWWLKDIWARFQ